MKVPFIFWMVCLVLSSRGSSQGISAERDVPYPSRYEIRTTPEGRRYVVVRAFERRRVADSFDAGRGATVSAGSVQAVHRRGRGTFVRLRAANGRRFGVRTGRTFAFGGRVFTALGFDQGTYVVRCNRSGQRFSFVR